MPDVRAIAWLTCSKDGTEIEYWLCRNDSRIFEWWSQGNNPKRLFGCSRADEDAAIRAMQDYADRAGEDWNVVIQHPAIFSVGDIPVEDSTC
jgi:hypothetical protein